MSVPQKPDAFPAVGGILNYPFNHHHKVPPFNRAVWCVGRPGKSTTIQYLGIKDQPSRFHMKQLYSCPGLIKKDEDVSAVYILFHKICNYAAQAKETLTHICRLTVKPVPHTVIQTEHLSTLLSLSPSTVRHSSHPGYASLFRARCEALWSENSCG
jgi:hypothetical protein